MDQSIKPGPQVRPQGADIKQAGWSSDERFEISSWSKAELKTTIEHRLDDPDQAMAAFADLANRDSARSKAMAAGDWVALTDREGKLDAAWQAEGKGVYSEKFRYPEAAALFSAHALALKTASVENAGVPTPMHQVDGAPQVDDESKAVKRDGQAQQVTVEGVSPAAVAAELPAPSSTAGQGADAPASTSQMTIDHRTSQAQQVTAEGVSPAAVAAEPPAPSSTAGQGADTPASVPQMTIDDRTLQALAAKRDVDRVEVERQLAEANAISRGRLRKAEPEMKDGGENEVQSDEVFHTAEDDRKPIIPVSVANKFLQVGDKFHFQRNPDAVAFHDRGNKLETRTNSPAVADAMVSIAQARGWDEIKVTGSETFKREVWIEAASRGMQVRGYEPNDADLARLKAAQSQPEFRGRETNKIAPAADTTQNKERADVFRTAQAQEALKKHPELAGSYAGIEAARRKVQQENLTDEQREVVMNRITKNAVNSLEKGHIPAVNVNESREVRMQAEVIRERQEKEIER